MRLEQASILIVEDEPVLCEIFAAWFQRVAGRVLTANNGAEALAILAANQVDIVVSDVRMPVMDGVTLLKRLKAGGSKVPSVILITGFSDLDLREAYDLGAEAVLEKPIERDLLLQAARGSLTSREELWREPKDLMPEAALKAGFAGLEPAVQSGKIRFGYGGFCLESVLRLHEGPIVIFFEFQNDPVRLEGQGIVRWVAPAEKLIGVELLYVDDKHRALVAELAERAEPAAFIPGSLRTERGPEVETSRGGATALGHP